MYLAAGDIMKAVTIYGEKAWLDDLIELTRSFDKSQIEALTKAASYFKKHGHTQYTIETYLKMGGIF
jgi:hypothetical protein